MFNLLEQNPEERNKKLDQIEEALQNISLNVWEENKAG